MEEAVERRDMEGFSERRVESREQESINEEMTCDFLDITKPELEGVRERIRGVKGHVRVSVHPLYLSRHPGTFYVEGPHVPMTDVETLLVDGFEKTVESVARSRSSSPLLIFEEHQFVDETRDIVASIADTDRARLTEAGFLFLKTDQDNGSLHGLAAARTYEGSNSVPLRDQASHLEEKQRKLTEEIRVRVLHPRAADGPIIVADEEKIKLLQERRKLFEDMDRLDDLLNERREAVLDSIVPTLGIRSALISGGYFYNNKVSGSEQDKLYGCAGSVTTALRRRGVKVDISRFAWSPRDYLQEQGIQTRQTGKDKPEQNENV